MGLVPSEEDGGSIRVDNPNFIDPQFTAKRPVSAKEPRRYRFFLILGTLAVLFLFVVACSTGKQSTWDPVGPVAEKQLQLFNVLLWTMVAVFVAVQPICSTVSAV